MAAGTRLAAEGRPVISRMTSGAHEGFMDEIRKAGHVLTVNMDCLLSE